MLPKIDEMRARLRGHLPALDGMRGLAIFVVLVHNAAGPEGPRGGTGLALFDVATNIGWVGVQLFFVLSGFLITGILLDTRGAPGALRAFYMRRFLRIFPLYYAALAAFFIGVPLVFGVAAKATSHGLAYLLYVQNWSPAIVTAGGAGHLGHFWSLAVEEQFYLVWPMLVLTMPRRAFTWTAAAFVAIALAARVGVVASGASLEWAYQSTIARVDGLAMGGLAAVALRDEAALAWTTRRARTVGAVALLALGAITVVTRGFGRLHPLSLTLGYSVLGVAFTALVVDAIVRPSIVSRVLEARSLRLLGTYSYGVYVFHMPISGVLHDRFGLDFANGSTLHRVALRSALALATLALSLAVAVVSFHVLERPFLRLKRHFTAAREA